MMAVYNGFPATYYQPNMANTMYQQPIQQVQPAVNQTQQTGNGLVWVQGEAAAKSYPLAPNTTVLLMDSEGDRFFLKSADASGMPLPLRVFEYHERTAQTVKPNQPAPAGFVTKDEFDALRNDFEAFRREFIPASPLTNEGESNG